MTKFIIMSRRAKMPLSIRDAYDRIAVVEVDPEALARLGRREPAMITPRARGVRRIVEVWGPVPASGRTGRSGRGRAIDEARALVARLEAEAEAAAKAA